MDPRVTASFVCQRCLQPLQIDPSFLLLNEHVLAELALPIYPEEELEFDSTCVNKYVGPPQLFDSGHQPHGFTFVGDSSDVEKTQPMKVATGLFDLVSCNSDVDHPLCELCTDSLLDLMDTSLSRTQKQAHMYTQLLKTLNDSPQNQQTVAQLEDELSKLEEEENRLIAELAQVEKEQAKAQEVLAEHQQVQGRLRNEEERFWREYCTHKSQVMHMEEENHSLKSQLVYTQKQLDKLKHTNVFNITFHIWHLGHFGTINNLRLGRLPTSSVSWNEINAAWGQTTLLLASLARKIGLNFKRYKLVPYGDQSYIEVLDNSGNLPLYNYGSFRLFVNAKYDAAMVAFLECLSEFQHHVETQGSQANRFRLPYKVVNKAYIEDSKNGITCCIKVQFTSAEEWTKALKFVLTNLRWGLTWISYDGFSNT
ncbi:beclin-1-like protein [Oratosquilla oratoria]|uniref:beclin-1-like protein n=1 Tax=Oratosquilla oratoria TaxID=337810 RepID=UPI003F7763C7